ncbi:MAG: pentapeptide repeat-containing protein [Acidobacteriota bacterium]|nr:pentapeptide repeat-containing protein [Acidobacteriota bacterium]
MGAAPLIEAALRAHALWLAHDPLGVRADLRQQSFRGASLGGCVLDGALLRDADFSGASLAGASFVRADLRFASLRNADLRDADLSGARLDFASLAGARLTDARLDGASMNEADLEGIAMSWFDHTLLAEVLWRGADGDVERQMAAAFIGRRLNFCWDEFACLPPKHRRWVLDELRRRVRPGDGAPLLISAPRPRATASCALEEPLDAHATRD